MTIAEYKPQPPMTNEYANNNKHDIEIKYFYAKDDYEFQNEPVKVIIKTITTSVEDTPTHTYEATENVKEYVEEMLKVFNLATRIGKVITLQVSEE